MPTGRISGRPATHVQICGTKEQELMAVTIGSLFSGIGGFELGFEGAGFGPVKWQFEIDKSANMILERYWPDCKRLGDIRSFWDHDLEPVDIITGGDPCQCRSRARGNRRPRTPDLSGYFLAVVFAIRPRWVVRENVPSSDVVGFIAALERMGYGAIVMQYDGADFTSQSRVRQFVVGQYRRSSLDLAARVDLASWDRRAGTQTGKKRESLAANITTHPYRYGEADNFIYEDGVGKIRVLSAEERERLQGFPAGWTAGLSYYRRCILIGNAVMPPVVEEIGKFIKEAA